jgi:hypothetical protein
MLLTVSFSASALSRLAKLSGVMSSAKASDGRSANKTAMIRV